jgi:hypothetical protein
MVHDPVVAAIRERTPADDRADGDITAQLELRALERMVAALCRHVEQLAREARTRGALKCREATLQIEVYMERRRQALDVLQTDVREPCETRIARLEKHVEALDCSRAYFRTAGPTA